MVTYRPMRPEEAPAVAQLWSEVFDTPKTVQAARLAGDPAPSAHTYVAARSDGELLASAHYQVAQRRDLRGEPLLVGEVDSIATRAGARRQGHATALLRLVQGALEREGCAWALLVTTAAGRALYEREGWRPYPERWVRGEIDPAAIRLSPHYVAYPFDPRRTEDGWERLAAVDTAFNAHRPLTAVRTSSFWRTRAAQRIHEWMETEGLMVYVASQGSSGGQACGYALAEFYPTAFQIRDLAVLPTEPGALEALLGVVSQEAQARGIPPTTRLFLPREAWVEATLQRLLGGSLRWGEDAGQVMARPIGRQFSEQALDELFRAPEALFSSLDLF